ncbi:hypothetical protein ACFPT7_14810 [Acidicapsa dinghuensis]|uniref:Uncharacterized protein n=1 Tax=Acidicapsa dinghuensis TaxID=2218256 RepID=A0ABW1EJY5_9BACT|nr:hypothetical protein [Acidicapsa dinghuensis]
MSKELEDKNPETIDSSAKKIPLPGMVAIALYMLVLAATVAFGVVGKHLPWMMIVLMPVFVVAAFGLLRLFRWAWALTISACFLLMTYNVWLFLEQKQAAGAIQGFLNLLFFFYLVREDVRSRLR